MVVFNIICGENIALRGCEWFWILSFSNFCVFHWNIFKAYVHCFFFFISALQKLWKMLFTTSKNLFSFSKYSNLRNFSFPFHTFQIQKDKWKWKNLCCGESTWINKGKFWNLKNRFVLFHQTWSSNTSLRKRFFWTAFVTWKATGHYFQAPFALHNIVH